MNENYFFLQIKNSCKNIGKKYNILPSILASFANFITANGSIIYKNNLYSYKDIKHWDGRCYSITTKNSYENKSSIPLEEEYSIIAREYDSYNDSIEDFAKYLSTARRNGDRSPLKYSNIIGLSDYNRAIDLLTADGIFTSFFNYITDIDKTAYFIKNSIINYSLYKWDKEN